MQKIQMVDLHSQYLKIKPEIDEAIQNVINSSEFVKGSDVKIFEKNLASFLDVKHVISCANGTDALQLALMALDLQAGDEVITPNFTFIATAEVIALLGLIPVFVDVNPTTFTIDTQAILKAITPRTKAIMPVHLFGQASEMNEIIEIAKNYNLHIIEDTAQALGADYFIQNKSQKLGTLGDIGCTSFFPSKNLGAFGDGGAVFTNNDELAEKIRILANHGMKVRYYHDFIGINSRLDGIQAAILNVKLKNLNQYNYERQKAADFYDKAFQKCEFVQIPERNNNSTHIFHQYTLKIKHKRDELKEYLEKKAIPTMIYFPLALNKQKAFANSNVSKIYFPVSETLPNQVLSLPMHTELSLQQLEYITTSVLEFFKQEN